MISIQRQLELERAVAATVGMSASNSLVTASAAALLDDWTSESNVLRPKAGRASSGLAMGTTTATVEVSKTNHATDFTDVGANLVDTAGVWRNAVLTSSNGFNYSGGLNPSGSTNGSNNFNTTYTNPYVITASTQGTAEDNSSTWVGWAIADGQPNDFTRFWWSNAPPGGDWVAVDMGQACAVGKFSMVGHPSAANLSPNNFGLQYSLDGSTNWTSLSITGKGTTVTDAAFGTSKSPDYVITTPVSARYYRLLVDGTQGGAAFVVSELYLNLAAAATTLNTASSTNFCTTARTFISSTLVMTDGADAAITTDTVNLYYKLDNGGAWTGPVSRSAFIALGDLGPTSYLFLKVQPIGTQTLKSVSLSYRVSADLTLLETGQMTIVKDSVTTFDSDIVVDGPTSATDGGIAVFDGTTGKLVKDGGQSFLSAAVNTTDATVTTILSIPVAASKTVSVMLDVIANGTTDTANKAVYRIHGVFYRNSTGNVTALGDLVSVNTAEVDAAWDATMAVNTGTQAIDVKVTGASAKNISWSAACIVHVA